MGEETRRLSREGDLEILFTLFGDGERENELLGERETLRRGDLDGVRFLGEDERLAIHPLGDLLNLPGGEGLLLSENTINK